jgi:hypothetical protein
MALTPDQLKAIERASNRVAATSIPFVRTYQGEEFTLLFQATVNQPALRIVGHIQTVGVGNGDLVELWDALVEFMDVMSAGGTGELIAELARAGIMQVGDLIELQQAVVAEVGGRPTERSSSSATGSPKDGPGLTASAPTGASTPGASPLIDS